MAYIQNPGQIKVIFDLNAEDWHGHATESLWATPVALKKNVAVVDNCPFFVRGVSVGDSMQVAGSCSPFAFDRVVAKSGYATLRVLIESYDLKQHRATQLLAEMRSLGCKYEGGLVGDAQLFSIAVPPEADVSEIVAIVDRGCREDIWDAEVADNGGRSGFWDSESSDSAQG